MSNNITLSEKIQFDNISREEFQEFVDALKEADGAVYQEEGADGFLDLYSYWNNVVAERGGKRSFNAKILTNKEKVDAKK